MERYRALLSHLRDAVLSGPGTLDPEVRSAAAGGGGEVPLALHSYVNKVTQEAYKVTDRDVEELLAAGYSEDQVFELTVSAALGAGLCRFEAATRALEQDRLRREGD